MQRLFWLRENDPLIKSPAQSAAKTTHSLAISGRWREQDVPAGATLIAESFLVAEGKLHASAAHETRFAHSLHAIDGGVRESELIDFWRAVWQLLPATGNWFPRIEAYKTPAGEVQLACWIRSAPPLKDTVTLWVYKGEDPRKTPTVKGPEVAELEGLRVLAELQGAEDAVLTGRGLALEITRAAIMWWEDDTLCYVDTRENILLSTTVVTVIDVAKKLGYKTKPATIAAAELAEHETWAVNALHGIRLVTAWHESPQRIMPGVSGCVKRFNEFKQEYARRVETLAEAETRAARGAVIGAATDAGAMAAPGSKPETDGARLKAVLRSTKVTFNGDSERLFSTLFAGSDTAFWLDSSRVIPGLSRYSIMGCSEGELAEVLTARASSGVVIQHSGRSPAQVTRALQGDIFEVLKSRISAAEISYSDNLPFAYAGGYVGYFGYGIKGDCGSANKFAAHEPDAVWVRATRSIVIDHVTGQLWALAVQGGGDETAEKWLSLAIRAAGEAGRAGEDVPVAGVSLGAHDEKVAALLSHTAAEYQDLVRRAQGALQQGDSYEICLTSNIKKPIQLDGQASQRDYARAAYARLRSTNPAPYAGYLQFGGVHILSSSPERFLKISANGDCETKPIKGTVRRGIDAPEDKKLREQLTTDPKTRAENLMIVDLLRNDLSRVCVRGTVTVPVFMGVESYATVHQLVSTVRGRLRQGVGAVMAAKACFPGGSMTGAPKLRTIEIIEDLERRARGIYSGALGFFSYNGAADLSVVIRTAVIQGGVCEIGAGGAVVLDSVPAVEYEEALLKARVVAGAVLDL